MEEELLNKNKTQLDANISYPDKLAQSNITNSSDLPEKSLLRRKTLLIFVLLLAIFISALVFVILKPKSTNNTIGNFPQPSTSINAPPTANSITEIPSVTQISQQTVKPSYKAGEFLTFTHFAQGYSIGYPAELVPELSGAEGGNFFLEIGNTSNKSSILIYPQYPKQDLSKLNLDNVIELSYDYWGGQPRKIVSSEEKIITKEEVKIGGIRAFKIISNVERIIVPKQKSVLVFEIQNKNANTNIIDQIINTFSLISTIPNNWKLYSDTKITGFKIKYPSNYEVKKLENSSSQSYDVVFVGPGGNITFNFYNDSSPIKKDFASAHDYSSNINAAIQAEQLLKEDVITSKFNQNAFTFEQGGDYAIRVIHPLKQDFNLYFIFSSYFNPLGFPSIKVNAPIALEQTVNQMLMSLNEDDVVRGKNN